MAILLSRVPRGRRAGREVSDLDAGLFGVLPPRVASLYFIESCMILVLKASSLESGAVPVSRLY